MTPRARWILAIAAFVVMGTALLVGGGDEWEHTATTYGEIPHGYGALHDLLTELGLSQGRSFREGDALPAGATVWWIAPYGLCRGVEDADLSAAESGIWHSLRWIEGGGTAVIFLPDAPLACLEEIEVGETRMPSRSGEADDDEAGEETAATVVQGTLHPQPRSLGGIPLRTFAEVQGFEVLASDGAGRAVVVARPWGKGHLVLVSTAAPLMNRWLDRENAALVAVDLAVAYGAPFIDEREHGLLPASRAIPYLLRSPALPALGGTLLLALIALWWGRAPLPSRIEPEVPPPPRLDTFVASIGALYAKTRDDAAVLRAYQELALGQLRRLFLLPPETKPEDVRDRVLAARRVERAEFEVLLEPRPVRRRSDLFDEVARIDAIVARVAR